MPEAPASPPSPPAICPRCGQPNLCAMAAGAAPASCWCMQMESIPPATLPVPAADAACYCPACLQALRTQAPTA